jgi:hypothetical protein
MDIISPQKLNNYNILYDTKKIRFGRLTSNKDILSLFKIIFDRDFKEDLLNWFAACPTGSNRWYGAFEIDEPVGIYGLLPVKIRIGNTTHEGALGNNVGVMLPFLGKGLFQALGEFSLKDSNFPIAVCVPNAMARLGHKAIGWKEYGILELLSGNVGERNIDFVGYNKFEYIPCQNEPYFYIVKDRNFMKWRYSKPGEEYFQSFFENNNYAIWKNYQGKKQVLEISDYNLIYKLNGTVDIWQFKDSRASAQLKNNGFVPILSNEFIVYTDLNVERDVNLFNFEPGDNDVF